MQKLILVVISVLLVFHLHRSYAGEITTKKTTTITKESPSDLLAKLLNNVDSLNSGHKFTIEQLFDDNVPIEKQLVEQNSIEQDESEVKNSTSHHDKSAPASKRSRRLDCIDAHNILRYAHGAPALVKDAEVSIHILCLGRKS